MKIAKETKKEKKTLEEIIGELKKVVRYGTAMYAVMGLCFIMPELVNDGFVSVCPEIGMFLFFYLMFYGMWNIFVIMFPNEMDF